MKNIPDDIKQLDEKIKLLRQKQDKGKNSSNKDESMRASRIGFKIATELLSAVIIGGAIGYLLDDLFGIRPWCLAIFLLFGGMAGFLNVYRMAQEEDKKIKENI